MTVQSEVRKQVSLPSLVNLQVGVLLDVHVVDVTTQEPGVLERGFAETANLLATLNRERALGDPGVRVVLVGARHLDLNVWGG